MYRFRQLGTADVDGALLARCRGRTIAQTNPWLSFIQETQGAEPIVVEIRQGDHAVGYFFGAIERKFGIRILGSPFTGWTTSYMGLCLETDQDRTLILPELIRFAWHQLRVHHVELMDRHLSMEAAVRTGLAHRALGTYEIDLRRPEADLFAKMKGSCRTCIRKAEKAGVVIEEVADPSTFADLYHDMLKSVFAGQGAVPKYGKARVESLVRHLHPTGHLLLLVARNAEGLAVASGIFPARFDHMYFWGNASYHAHTQVRPNELMHWHAMRYWKARGIAFYDMGGGGAYKRKYGGERIEVPWFVIPRWRILGRLRTYAMGAVKLARRLRGRVRSGERQRHEG